MLFSVLTTFSIFHLHLLNIRVCVCVFSSFFKNTRVALDHLESIPEKQLLMENFRDLEVRITYNLDYVFYLTRKN